MAAKVEKSWGPNSLVSGCCYDIWLIWFESYRSKLKYIARVAQDKCLCSHFSNIIWGQRPIIFSAVWSFGLHNVDWRSTHTYAHADTLPHHPWCVRACCVHSRLGSACLTLLTWVHSFLRWLAAHANTTQPWLAVRATLCPSHNAPGPSPSIDAELASLSRYSDLLPLQS